MEKVKRKEVYPRNPRELAIYEYGKKSGRRQLQIEIKEILGIEEVPNEEVSDGN